MTMARDLSTSLLFLALCTAVFGLAYPAVVTVLAQELFPEKANGSILTLDGTAVGSDLIGQQFYGPGFFWGRPSATADHPCNAAASAGSNLGPTNPSLVDAVRGRVAALRLADPGNAAPVPVDLVTASASGLDPHISPGAAFYQAARVARTRGVAESEVRALIEEHVEVGPWPFGEPRVNVLRLNLALEGLAWGERAGVASHPEESQAR
jgi:potassium-transporting ATPase KdpC subunit